MYALWDAGKRLPPLEWEPGSIWMKCPCGAIFNSHKPAESYDHRAHIYAAQARQGP
jgi:hypothetical protein